MSAKYPDPLKREVDPETGLPVADGLQHAEELRAKRKYSREGVERFVADAKRLLPPGAFMQLFLMLCVDMQPSGMTTVQDRRSKAVMQQLYLSFRDAIPWMKVNILYGMREEIFETTDYRGRPFPGGMSMVFIKAYAALARLADATEEKAKENG